MGPLPMGMPCQVVCMPCAYYTYTPFDVGHFWHRLDSLCCAQLQPPLHLFVMIYQVSNTWNSNLIVALYKQLPAIDWTCRLNSDWLSGYKHLLNVGEEGMYRSILFLPPPPPPPHLVHDFTSDYFASYVLGKHRNGERASWKPHEGVAGASALYILVCNTYRSK